MAILPAQIVAGEWVPSRRTHHANTGPIRRTSSSHLPALEEPQPLELPNTLPETSHPLPPAPPVEKPATAIPTSLTPMSLADFEALALSSHPALIRASARINGAYGRVVQAGLKPNPTIGYRGDDIGLDGSDGQHGGFVSQTIVAKEKVSTGRNAARFEQSREEHNQQATRFRVLNDVRVQFYVLLAAEKRLEIAGELFALHKRDLAAMEQRLKQEDASRVDVLRTRLETEEAALEVESARASVAAAWREMTAFVGEAGLQPSPLAGDLTEKTSIHSWEMTLQTVLANSPELAAARADVQRACWAIRHAQAQNRPDWDVGVSVQYDTQLDSTFTGVEVGMPLPVFNRNQGRIREAQAELAGARAKVIQTERALQMRLARVYREYDAAVRQLKHFDKEIAPNAKETLKLVEAGFVEGELSVLDVLDAQRTYARQKQKHVELQLNRQKAALQIEGLLLTGSLTVE